MLSCVEYGFSVPIRQARRRAKWCAETSIVTGIADKTWLRVRDGVIRVNPVRRLRSPGPRARLSPPQDAPFQHEPPLSHARAQRFSECLVPSDPPPLWLDVEV